MAIETEGIKTSSHPDAPIDQYSLRDQVAATLQELSKRQEDIYVEMQALMDKIVASRRAVGPFCAEVGEGNHRIVILKHFDHDGQTNTFTHFFLSANGPMAIEVKYPEEPSKEGLRGIIAMGRLDRVHRQHLLFLISDLCERQSQDPRDKGSSAGLTTDGQSSILSLSPLPGRSENEDLVITSDRGQNPRIVPAAEDKLVKALFESMYRFPEK